jgi:hypothetical protein
MINKMYVPCVPYSAILELLTVLTVNKKFYHYYVLLHLPGRAISVTGKAAPTADLPGSMSLCDNVF